MDDKAVETRDDFAAADIGLPVLTVARHMSSLGYYSPHAGRVYGPHTDRGQREQPQQSVSLQPLGLHQPLIAPFPPCDLPEGDMVPFQI